MRELLPLDARLLHRPCDPAWLDFTTTGDLQDLDGTLGQARAIDAIRFAIGMRQPGYHLFVLGEPGSGRHAVARRLLEERAAQEQAPPDWCYAHNFAEPNRPNAFSLPAGQGRKLRAHMERFVDEVGHAIDAARDSDEFRSRVEAIQTDFKAREENALRQLGQEASEHGIALLRTTQGFVFAPMKGEAPMDPEEFARLPEEDKNRFSKLLDEYGDKLQKLMHQFPRWRREMLARLKDAGRQVVDIAVNHLIDELKAAYSDLPDVLDFLSRVRDDVVGMGEALHAEELRDEAKTGLFQRYQVNLLVDNGTCPGAPVVYEENPNYPNLVGRIDQIAQMGLLVTNFTLIRAGALHAANGGYLMVDAVRILSQPYAWEGLKRALKMARVRIENLGQALGWASTVAMEPEPIPLELKAILFGDRLTYYLLQEYDPEFEEFFKVPADFDSSLDRTEANVRAYARLVARIVRGSGLRHFTREAVQCVIEHSSRLAEDAEKLSARSRPIVELLHEADYWAQQAAHDVVTRVDVERALKERVRRLERLRETLYEEIQRDVLLVSSSGEQIGQVNGLMVIELGGFRFGHPVRITATARIGEGDVLDIERESELGGPIHSKGVMILESFLGTRYARRVPLALSASLVFEQSYGPVEGDSASLAELCALLSSLSGVGIKQSLAVTGSVNQYGKVQAVGAVNEKVEGFFDICRLRGLTGDQGAVIPAANVKHLMLREDVVAAAVEGKFSLYAVEDVDEAIEVLTGVAAGEPDEFGRVPTGSINYLVAVQLNEMSVLRQEYGGHAKPRRRRKEE